MFHCKFVPLWFLPSTPLVFLFQLPINWFAVQALVGTFFVSDLPVVITGQLVLAPRLSSVVSSPQILSSSLSSLFTSSRSYSLPLFLDHHGVCSLLKESNGSEFKNYNLTLPNISTSIPTKKIGEVIQPPVHLHTRSRQHM